MTRKRKKINTANESQAYWERILTQEGFSMSRGSLRDDPKQKRAVKKFLRDNQIAVITEKEAAEAGLDIVSDEE